jgi:hypothetical protein
MNLVGKIFVVLIIVMALVFMAITLAVYTTQRNWRDEVMRPQSEVAGNKDLGLKNQVTRLKTDYQNLKDVKEAVEKELATAKNSFVQTKTKLENQLVLAIKEQKSLQAGRADLEKRTRDAEAALNATQKNCTDYRAQLEKMRTDLLNAQQDRDKIWTDLVNRTDELNSAANERDEFRRQLADSAKDLASAKECLRYFDINMNSDYKNANPPKVDGVVTGVLDSGVIEISLGSDQGIRKGHLLQLYRVNGGQSVYVGRVEVVKTDPSRSACKIDPKYQNSNVMVNDRVASKIE